MFYSNTLEKSFRLGDILRGFINITPKIKEPFFDKQNSDYSITIEYPEYSVVLSPCCSIGDKKICVTPLMQVRKSFYSNPHFVEDLTRINRKMRPQDAFAPDKWSVKSEQEKINILKDDFVYSLVELFIYAGHDSLPSYEMRLPGGKIKKTNCYLIDFRNIYKVDCDTILSPDKVPIAAKYLQLSINSRNELRDKLAYYFSRKPLEDELL
jgi:hypothetical protein